MAIPGYHDCPKCGVARKDSKLTKVGRKRGVDGIATFAADGCAALGLRHFGDSRVDRFTEGAAAVVFTKETALDLVQERPERRNAEREG